MTKSFRFPLLRGRPFRLSQCLSETEINRYLPHDVKREVVLFSVGNKRSSGRGCFGPLMTRVFKLFSFGPSVTSQGHGVGIHYLSEVLGQPVNLRRPQLNLYLTVRPWSFSQFNTRRSQIWTGPEFESYTCHRTFGFSTPRPSGKDCRLSLRLTSQSHLLRGRFLTTGIVWLKVSKRFCIGSSQVPSGKDLKRRMST